MTRYHALVEIPTFVRDAWEIIWVRAAALVVVSAILAKVFDILIIRTLRRVTRRTETDLDDQLLSQLHRPVFTSVLLIGLYFAVMTLKLNDSANRILIGAIQTAAILIWMIAAFKVLSTALLGLSRFADRGAWLDSRTLPLFDNLGKIAISALALYALLVTWDLDVVPWLASAGIVGIAIGFAAQDTLANLFGGLFVIVDAPYKLGDTIRLDSGERGRVVKMGLRSTRLMTRDDVEITLPNAQIANAKIVNESGGPYEKTRVIIQVGVAYGSDVDQVREVLASAASSVDDVVNDPEPRIRFTEMGDSALIFSIQAWVDEPEMRGLCVDGLNTAVYKALAKADIEIPFPQRVVHWNPPQNPREF